MVPHRFPFGREVTPCRPSAEGRRDAFILGAYPSALHVRWTPRKPLKPIAAIAVDNEPTPFWTGDDEGERIEAWKAAVRWDPAWGDIAPAGKLNGPSGAWVSDNVLAPLGFQRTDAWITDCLDTYRVSVGAAARLADTYRPFAAAAGLPSDNVRPHPTENEIATEALRDHGGRLTRELATARPDLIVTLGNAALRVLTGMAKVEGDVPAKLRAEAYGERLRIVIAGRTMEWLPLAHPAAPRVYQDAHARWRAGEIARVHPQ